MATQRRAGQFNIKRASANPRAPKIVKPAPVKKAKWDDKAKRRIIEHFQRELSVSHGVKR